MMKKILNVILVLIIVLINFIGIVDAYEPSTTLEGDTVIDRINDSEDVARSLITKLTNWSNSHASIIKNVINVDFISDLDLSDLNIQTLIDELNVKGYNVAASDLEVLNIQADLNYLKETFDMIEYYLEHDLTYDNVDETDILYNCRNVFKRLKNDIEILMKIYYNLYYDEINNKIDTFDDYSQLLDMYNNVSEKLVDTNETYVKVKQKIVKLRDLYISKNLEVHEAALKSELNEYYQRFKTDYDVLYNKLEIKLQNKLDEKINEIITGVDTTSIDEVENANNKLYEIINKISEVQDEVDFRFNEFNGLFEGINIVSEYSTIYETQIKNRLQTAYDYVTSKLLSLDFLLKVKYEVDKKYITIDHTNEIIVYNAVDLTPSILINKLLSNYDDLSIINTYNSKVGTLSKLQIHSLTSLIKEFKIIVKGDINPNGKFDITDLVLLCDKMYGILNLDQDQMIAADFDNNDKIDITDLVYLCDKIYE